MYRILFTRAAGKTLRRVSREIAQRIRGQLDLLAQDPYRQHSNVTKLQNRMLEDMRAYDEAKQALFADEDLVPSEVTYAILDGGNPVRVWREHRGLTQQQVANAAGISVPYLSQIESGKRTGSAEVLAAIARELKLSLDDIVVSPATPSS